MTTEAAWPDDETSRRTATEFLDRALALASVVVWRVDLHRQRAYFNAVGFQALGLAQTPQGISLQHIHNLTHPEDLSKVERANQLALGGEEVADLVVRYRAPDQTWRPHLTRRVAERNAQGQAVGFSGIAIDVSELQREREEEQRQRLTHQRYQQRAQFAIDSAGVGIWERDTHGHVLYWNPNMYRHRGCSSDDPRHPDEIMEQTTAAEDQELVRSTYAKHIANGEIYRKEYRLRLADGSLRWVLSHGRPVRDAQGQVAGMAGINLDVTERKNAQLLEIEKQRVEQASHEKSAFMTRMSHELRTPMNAVLGFSQLMRDDPTQPLTGPQLQRLGLIETAGQQLLKLINDLLEIAVRGDPPLVGSPPGAGALPPQQTPVKPAPAQQRLRVLCVEDNPVNLLLVQEVLALRPEVDLRCAENGLSGVAEALREAPDLVLLDLQLPDISGREVLKQLRSQAALANCRFVALSADAMPESIESALAAGFHDYWTKPIQFDRFLAHIDRLVAAQRPR